MSASAQNDYFWIGGSGNWSDISHWATTSGGSQNYGVIPSPQDNVFFDENSFSADDQFLNINVNRATFNDMDWSKIDRPIRLTGSGELESFGSIILSDQLTVEFVGDISFISSQADEIFKTANLQLNSSVTFRNGGVWTLQDSLKITDGYGIRIFNASFLAKETFIIADFIDAGDDEIRVLDFTNSTIELRSGATALNLNADQLTLTATGSHVSFVNDSPSSDLLTVTGSKPLILGDVSFLGFDGMSAINNQTNQTLTFADVRFNGNGILRGNNLMNDLSFGTGKFYQLEGSGTQKIIGEFTAAGDCQVLTTIRSTMSGEQAIVEKASGQVNLEFVDIMDISATGGATFNAANSVDSGNNSGWSIVLASGVDFYWIGGDGSWEDPQNWSLTSGGAPSGCLPSKNDNVFFDANSFSQPGQKVSLSSNVSCKTMDWTGALHNPTLENNTFFDHDILIYGSLKLIPGINFNLDGSLIFMSDQPGNTITTGNLNLISYFSFANPDGGWTLADSLKTNQIVNLNEGSLSTANNYVEASHFNTIGPGVRNLDLGASLIKVGNSAVMDLTNLTLDASKATISLFGNNAELTVNGTTSLASVAFNQIIFEDSENAVGNLRNDTADPDKILFRKVVLLRSADLNGDMQFDSLFFAPGKTYQLNSSSTKTINQYFEAKGDCSGAVLLKTMVAGSEATLSSVGATIDVERAVLKDLHSTGGAVFTANNSIDLGNNDGWTFTNVLVGTDLYWVGGDGNWHDVAHWSYSSGGPGGACIPTPADNVFFDDQSFTGTGQVVRVNGAARCRNMDWTGALFRPEISGSEALYISGSLTLISDMVYGITNRLTFDSNQPGNTITTGGIPITSGVQFFGIGGGWELLDGFTTPKLTSIDHLAGELKTNGNDLSGGFFNSSSDHVRGLDFGTSQVTMSTVSISFTDKLTFDFANTNFILEDENPTLQILLTVKADVNFGNLQMNVTNPLRFGSLNVHPLINDFSSPNFKTIRLNGNSSLYFGNRKSTMDSLLLEPGFEYIISAKDTLSIKDYLLANGDCSTRLTLRSNSSSGEAFFIEKPADDITIAYVSLENSHIYGPGTFKANNTRDLGGNDGWLINSEIGTQLYWVGGTGDWSDPAHWALTSGGPGGACVPFIYDDVFFDENSFDATGQEVRLDNRGYCRSMDWTGAQFNPVFSGDQSLEMFGSLELNADMSYQHNATLFFMSDSLGNSITTHGTALGASIQFSGKGEWILMDNLSAAGDVTLNFGKLDLNRNTLSGSHFRSENDNERKLHMSEATIVAHQDFRSVTLNTTNLELVAAGSSFNLTAGSNPEFIVEGKDSVSFGSVLFNTVGNGGIVRGFLNTIEYDFIGVFEDLSFDGNGTILGNHQFNNLTFAPGQIYQIQANSVQTIIGNWNMTGIGCSPIIIESSQSGQKYQVIKTSGTVNGLYLRLTDSEVLGGGTFIATNSSDVSNNSGWDFVIEAIVVEDILGLDQEVCEGEPVVLDASFGAANESFVWNDGSTASTLNVTQSGKYWVSVSIGQSCLLSDTVNVDFKPLPVVDLGEDITTCEEQPVTLDATNTNAGATYLWSDGSTGSTLEVDATGDYWVDVTLADCPVRDSIFVMVDPIPRIDLGPDLVVSCEDDQVILDATFDGATYLWQDGSTNPTFAVVSPGTYTVMLDRNGCLFTDEIQVDFEDYPVADLGPDLILCPLEENTLDASQAISGNFTYLWSDGSVSPTFKVEAEGEVWVTVSNGVCSETDTLNVSFIPELVLDLGPDVIICEGDVLPLDATNPNATYTWSTGETTASIEITEAGTYAVEVTDGCYTVNDEITVEVDILPTVDLGEDVGICFYDTLKMDVSINSIKAEYLWEDGSTSPTRDIYEEGLYSVSITNGLCGTVTDEIVVTRDFCGCEIFAPNVFSPNADGSNDTFNTVLSCPANSFTLSIYNRWGVLIFRTTDPDRGWDGTYEGKEVSGNLLWTVTYTSIRTNGSLEKISGNGVFRVLR